MSDKIRRFVRDALEAAAVALGTIVFVIPSTLDAAKAQALIAAVAVGAAVWAVARRELWPIILEWIWPKP